MAFSWTPFRASVFPPFVFFDTTGKPAPVGVREPETLAPKPGSEHTVFLSQVVGHILLLAVDPARTSSRNCTWHVMMDPKITPSVQTIVQPKALGPVAKHRR